MASISPEIAAHREWLGQIQPVGLVVSPSVLVKRNVGVDRQRGIEKQAQLRGLLEAQETLPSFLTFAHEILEWPANLLAGSPAGPPLPDALTISLPEYDDTLSPTYALMAESGSPATDLHVEGGPDLRAQAGAGASPVHPLDSARDTQLGREESPAARDFSPADLVLLISVVPAGTDLDRPPADHRGWRASPHARLERLLRETGVPVGLLFNGASLRLVYAPRGESSGHLTFNLASLTETLARPMVSALDALLGVNRVTDVLPDDQRLPALLRESRRYQNEVSTALAGQVLEALWELLRGFQRADDDSKGVLLGAALREDPHEVYGGLLSTLMRLVFILYAEDRGLMPQSDVYQRHYAVSGLFQRLREDQARYPDTMDARYGAWAQLLSLFRLIHDGGGHGDLRFTARHGRLFNPDVYPFLEGRPTHSARQLGEILEAPRVPDGTVFRVLQNLLILDGERLSYRALDVEQIGSVYEAMMGFALEQAKAPSIALSPKHIVINLEELLAQKGKDRAAWIKEHAELKISSDALAKADSVPELIGALGSRVSRYTPHQLDVGAMFLQPTEERRRSGSHYTPRSLTEPIVRTTLRPILERLGTQATPEQILDLKVCDPAMGSGAFLVEACRLLGERLVRAWEVHKVTPKVPDDEDVLTYARRLVAERCLYGVDKNIFAVDLAKLSLWLATLAREHPFTFLDHALRHGDSLVGLSREQIACLHWNPGKQLPLIRGFIDGRVAEAQRLRERIQGMGSSDDVPEKARLLRDAEDAIAEVHLIGDVIVSAFFERDKPKEREALRVVYAGKIETWLDAARHPGFTSPKPASPGTAGEGGPNALDLDLELQGIRSSLRSGNHAIPAFHWELEFPEVLTRANGGFDAFVGNPPFAGKNTLLGSHRHGYADFLKLLHSGSAPNADLVAHFFRRAFALLRRNGCLGLIATNSIAQGDSRVTALQFITEHGGAILEARRRIPWIGRASVIVSIVYVVLGDYMGQPRIDGVPVQRVSAYLLEGTQDAEPSSLVTNAGICFEGVKIYGSGFLFGESEPNSLTEMESLAKKSWNQDRIVPYFGGREVNASPTLTPTRFVINLEGLTEAEAAEWPELMTIVRTKVKPEREALEDGNPAKRHWWRWERARPELVGRLRALDAAIVLARTSDTYAPTIASSRFTFNDSVVVFADDSYNLFAILASRIHELWARTFSSTIKDDLQYRPSRAFDTFPMPNLHTCRTAEQAGRDYFAARTVLMVDAGQGLTATYNRFHDPDERDAGILRLRELHDAMDRAVLDAYGWTDIRPTCRFILDYDDEDDDTPGKPSKKRKPWRYRWPDDIRDDVLGRLLALNAERAKEEALAGAAAKALEVRSPKPKRRTKTLADTPLLSADVADSDDE